MRFGQQCISAGVCLFLISFPSLLSGLHSASRRGYLVSWAPLSVPLVLLLSFRWLLLRFFGPSLLLFSLRELPCLRHSSAVEYPRAGFLCSLTLLLLVVLLDLGPVDRPVSFCKEDP